MRQMGHRTRHVSLGSSVSFFKLLRIERSLPTVFRKNKKSQFFVRTGKLVFYSNTHTNECYGRRLFANDRYLYGSTTPVRF